MPPAQPSSEKKSRAPKKASGASKKIAPRLVALSSAAVLTIYTVGYLRIRSAAEGFAVDGAQRRTAGPAEAGPAATRPAPPPSVDASGRSTVRGTPAARASSAPSPRLSPAPDAASTPAPVPESTEAPTVAPVIPPVAPTAMPTAAPVAIEGDLPTPEPPAESIVATQPYYRDGTYSGYGTSRHGDIEATVVIEGGRIASAAISRCLTRYSCSWISMLPGQVVSRQRADVDYVSGATQSTNAYYYAVLEALSKAK